MNILITGGAGFLGSNLAAYHLRLKHNVHIIDNFSTGKKENIQKFLNNKLFTYTADTLLTCPDLKDIVSNADRVYHMAAIVGVFRVIQRPLQVLEENIWGTKRLLEAFPKKHASQRLIFASTSEVYGSANKALKETDAATICSPTQFRINYAISKLTDEALILSYCKTYNIKATVLRIFNTIGPNQTGRYGMVVPRFVKAAIQNHPLQVYGDGTQTRSFCDVRDFVHLVDKIAANPRAINNIVNIGNDAEISILDLAKTVIRLANSKSKIAFVPYDEVYGENYQDIMFRRPDLTYLKSLTDNYSYMWDLNKTLLDLIQLNYDHGAAIYD